MKPELVNFLDKARQCLSEGRAISSLEAASNSIGRDAYLTAFHAAQAYIFALSGKVAKTHNGVNALFAQLAKEDKHIPQDLQRFVTQAYDLKAVADYEMGEGSTIPFDRSIAALETAGRFYDCIAARIENVTSGNAE